jgi:hypothetical protein
MIIIFRLNLQSWLPTELWNDINPMLVGFGQVKTHLPSFVILPAPLRPAPYSHISTYQLDRRQYAFQLGVDVRIAPFPPRVSALARMYVARPASLARR